MPYYWIAVPVLSAAIGWLAVRMAIWLLFHPRKPRNIMGIKIQGYLPGRQQALAWQLGELVAAEVLSFGDIAARISSPANVQRIMPQVEGHIDQFLRVRLPEQMPVISMFVGDKTLAELKALFLAEMETLFPVVMNGYMNNLEDQLDLGSIISGRISGVSAEGIEQVVRQVLAGAFRFLQVMGLVLGLVIGALAVVMCS